MKVGKIRETAIYGRNLDEMEEFYSRILGLELYSKKDGAFLFYKVGDGMLLIFNPDYTRRNESVPPHGCDGEGHVAFDRGSRTIEEWEEYLQSMGVKIEAVVKWNGGKSIYFRDPAGNSVEIIEPSIWGLE